MVEEAPPRRADRREPERRGKDDRVGLLGAAAPRRAGLDAASMGRGRFRPRPPLVHDAGGAGARRRARSPLRGSALPPPVAQEGALDARRLRRRLSAPVVRTRGLSACPSALLTGSACSGSSG